MRGRWRGVAATAVHAGWCRHVCERHARRLPVTTVEELRAQLDD
jgi:hypothetical protein